MPNALWNSPCIGALAGFLLVAHPADGAPNVKRMGQNYVLSGNEVSVAISVDRGTVSNLQSLRPTPMDVLPNTQDGISLVVVDQRSGKRAVFNRPQKIVVRRNRLSAKLSVVLDADDAGLARLLRANIEYRMYADRFQVIARIKHIEDADGPFELALGQKNPRADFWQRQSFPGLAGNLDVLSEEGRKRAKHEVSSVSTPIYQRFNDHPNDATRVPEGVPLKICRYPYGILEGPDRFMIYGQMDVNGYLYLAAGHDDRNPCMLVTPRRLLRGQESRFDLTYKFFEKSAELDYADVCLWYAQNCYSTNRLTKGLVTIPKNLKARTLLGEGNEAGGPPIPVRDHPAYVEWAQKAHLVHLWDGWTEWDEIPTLNRSWINMQGQTQTEDSARSEIDERHRLGYRCYSYRRQLFPFYAYRDDRPWRKSWMLSTKPGTVFVCPSGPEPVDKLPHGDILAAGIEKHLREDLGLRVVKPGHVSFIHADFCNDECRNFYIRALENWIDKYECLDGFAFDMGWDIHTVPCLAHPDDGTHHGIVNLMAAVYKHLEKHHRNMRVVMNMLQGSPSNLWCHAVMFEGGVDITYEAVESVKIYRATMFAHYYLWQHKSVFGPDYVRRLEHNMLSNLGMGVIIGMGDAMAFAADPNFNNKLDLYALCARLSCVPLVTETGAFLVEGCSRREVYRSIFADRKSCYALIFNNTDEERKIRGTIRGRYLRTYGWDGRPIPRKVMHFDSSGYLRTVTDFETRKVGDDIVVEGTVGPGELVGITSDG